MKASTDKVHVFSDDGSVGYGATAAPDFVRDGVQKGEVLHTALFRGQTKSLTGPFRLHPAGG